MPVPSKYNSTKLNGHVEFTIPDVSHPAMGTATVSGKYRRLVAKAIRPQVVQSDVNILAEKLKIWANACGFKDDHFERFDMKTMAQTPALFAVYWLPGVAVDSAEMDFFSKFLFWTWLLDDAAEETWRQRRFHKGNLSMLQYVHSTYMNIFRKLPIDDPLPEIPEQPEFAHICNTIHSLAEAGEVLFGDEYAERIEPTVLAFECFLETLEWYTVSNIDGRYSSRAFQHWRCHNTGADSVLEAIAFVHGVIVSPKIRRSIAFKTLLSTMMSNVQLINDVLGAKKDFGYKEGDPDNTIVFEVLRKGVPINISVENACALMDNDLKDYVLTKQALIDMVGEDSMLLKYLDGMDTMIDGQNQVYMENARYRCNRGYIKLTREAKDEDPTCHLINHG